MTRSIIPFEIMWQGLSRTSTDVKVLLMAILRLCLGSPAAKQKKAAAKMAVANVGLIVLGYVC